MSSKILFLSSFLLLSVTACRTAPAESISLTDEIVYESEGTNLVEIFDLPSKAFFIESRNYLHTGKREGDFGTSFELCGNEEFHCIDDGLAIVVPKHDIGREWQLAGMSCRRLERAADLLDVEMALECQNSEETIEFTYSKSRGVTSYVRRCATCHKRWQKLLSPVGLFAARH